MCRKSEYPNLLERGAFKLHWNKPTGLVWRLHMFMHLGESQVGSAPQKGTVGWCQTTAGKMARWTESINSPTTTTTPPKNQNKHKN